MRFLVTGHRQGEPTEIVAQDYRKAVVAFRLATGQRAVAISEWCENPQHLHADGQWEPADELLAEVFQYEAARGPLTVFPNYPGSGWAPMADWAVFAQDGELAGFVVDSRRGDASASSPDDESERPFESWLWPGQARDLLGEWHSLRGASIVVVNRFNRS